MNSTVAIIGYGTASVNAAIALRRSGFAGVIQVFSNTGELPYSPVETSYYAAGLVSREQCFPWDEPTLSMLNLDVKKNCPVKKLDVANHLIITDEGEFPYDKCLIATGGTPSLEGVAQVGGFQPLVLRTMDDAQKLAETLADEACRRVLVSGTSMVALKTVEACLQRGVAVTLLGRSPHILRGTAVPEIVERYEQALASHGVELRLAQKVTAAAPSPEETGSIRPVDVTFTTGETCTFDAVVVAHGMVPNLQFVEEGALELDRGVLVDAYMRASNPDVYAAGDVAETVDPVTGDRHVSGLWKEACLQGACAGAAIAAELNGDKPAEDVAYTGQLRSNSITVQDFGMISAGSIGECPSRRVELEDRPCGLIARVFGQPEGEAAERMLGFNVYSDACTPGSPAFDEAEQLLNKIKDGIC